VWRFEIAKDKIGGFKPPHPIKTGLHYCFIFNFLAIIILFDIFAKQVSARVCRGEL